MDTTIKYFHKGNGHNYSITINGKTAQMERYYTNGHVNSNYEKSYPIPVEKMNEHMRTDLTKLEKYNPDLKEIAESVWFMDLKKIVYR